MTNPTLNRGTSDQFVAQMEASQKTILLYSPDMDFCMSFRLLYQDHYHLITTTDAKFMMPSVRILRPDLLVADLQPTEGTFQCLSNLKTMHRNMHIVLLYSPLEDEAPPVEDIPHCIDAILYKPLDIGELSSTITELLRAHLAHS